MRTGDRVGVIKGPLDGYYGHVVDRAINLQREVVGVQVKVIGNGLGATNQRFVGVEWFLPLHYVRHID